MPQLVKDFFHLARQKCLRGCAGAQSMRGHDSRAAARLSHAKDEIQVTGVAVGVSQAEHRPRIAELDAFEEEVRSELPPASIVRAAWPRDRVLDYCFDAAQSQLLDDRLQREPIDRLNGQEHNFADWKAMRRRSAACWLLHGMQRIDASEAPPRSYSYHCQHAPTILPAIRERADGPERITRAAAPLTYVVRRRR
jgi:hypothetical protein